MITKMLQLQTACLKQVCFGLFGPHQCSVALLPGRFCARNGTLCTNHPKVAHSALCPYIETGVHILPIEPFSTVYPYRDLGAYFANSG